MMVSTSGVTNRPVTPYCNATSSISKILPFAGALKPESDLGERWPNKPLSLTIDGLQVEVSHLDMQPFLINIAQNDLKDLQDRLVTMNWPYQLPATQIEMEAPDVLIADDCQFFRVFR